MQYDFNREAAKISALLSGKIDKYKYIAGEEILPLDQSRIKKQARFTYSSLGEAFKKQIKQATEEQGKKRNGTEEKQEKPVKAIKEKEINK